MISLHEFLDTCYWKLHRMYTNFCLKNLCCHRVSFEIGSYSCSYSLLLYSMCFILILVHLQFVAGMSAMLDVFVVTYQCCLNLTWEGFGIMLMTLTGWFDLVWGRMLQCRWAIYL